MEHFLNAIAPSVRQSRQPMPVPWPGTSSGILFVQSFEEWQRLVLDLALDPAVPRVIAEAYETVQKLYLLGWIDGSTIKAGDIVALSTLETALRDRYGHKIPRTGKQVRRGWRPGLSDLVTYMLETDAPNDQMLSTVRQYGGSVIAFLDGTREPSLTDIRNEHAHGFPFSPYWAGGLLHAVRDLILHIYRDMIAEGSAKSDRRAG